MNLYNALLLVATLAVKDSPLFNADAVNGDISREDASASPEEDVVSLRRAVAEFPDEVSNFALELSAVMSDYPRTPRK